MATDRDVALRSVDVRPVRVLGRSFGLAAGSILVASAVLQFAAAVQRWVYGDEFAAGLDRTIEDHLFDYVVPADPWVNVGSAATLFGLGYILIGVALVCLGAAARPRGQRASPVAIVAAIAAVPFVFVGLHALVSGAIGLVSPLQQVTVEYAVLLGACQVIALLVMAACVAPTSRLWALAVSALTGATLFGYVLSSFYVAPIVVGYQSYDTTPWTEGVVAAATAVSAAVTLTALLAVPRERQRVPARRRSTIRSARGFASTTRAGH